MSKDEGGGVRMGKDEGGVRSKDEVGVRMREE